MQETSLHASLKNYYSKPGDNQEVLIEGYYIDVLHDDILIEIQTKNFSAIKSKLLYLLPNYKICLVYPIAIERWIERIASQTDDILYRHRSPYHGKVEYIFNELVRIPSLIAHPNLSIEIPMIVEEQVHRDDQQGSWRRKGVSIIDRRLLSVRDVRVFSTPADFQRLLPENAPQPFSSKDIASKLRIPRRLATKMLYCMRGMGIIELVGKNGRMLSFKRIADVGGEDCDIMAIRN